VPKEPVVMEFIDRSGAVIRKFKSETGSSAKRDSIKTIALTGAALDSARTDSSINKPRKPVDSLAYFASDSIVTTRAGSNRFWWNLRYADAKRIKSVVNDEGTFNGPTAVPGEYRVRLIAGKDTLTRPFTIKLDPRMEATTADLQQTFELGMKVQGRMNGIVDAFSRIEDLQQQIDVRVDHSVEQDYAKRVKDAATPVRQALEVVRTELVDWFNHDDQATLHFPIKLYNMMLTLNAQVLGQEAAPTKQHGEILDDLGGKVDVQLLRLQQLEANEIKSLNALLQELGLPPIFVPPVKGKKTIS